MSRHNRTAILSRTPLHRLELSDNLNWAFTARSLPLALFGLLAAIPFTWNHFVGLSWREPDVLELALALPALGAISFYAWSRNARRLAEASAFLLLYLLYPLFGIRLSYLAATVNFPLEHDCLKLNTRKAGGFAPLAPQARTNGALAPAPPGEGPWTP